jgi:hypothetical protein
MEPLEQQIVFQFQQFGGQRLPQQVGTEARVHVRAASRPPPGLSRMEIVWAIPEIPTRAIRSPEPAVSPESPADL